MENINKKSERNFRQDAHIGQKKTSFFYNSFDHSKFTLRRSDDLFNFLCLKEVPLPVRKIYNIVETNTFHTQHGLYSTDGCILISELSAKLLKDEKTIKSYINEAINFFDTHKIAIVSKKIVNEKGVFKSLKQDQPIFDRLELVKTEKGMALAYSFSCPITQHIRSELTKDHFFKLYCLKHEIVVNKATKALEAELSDFLFSILKRDNCVPHDLINRVFSLTPDNLKLLKKQKLNTFSEDEYKLLKDANARYIATKGGEESPRLFVAVNSWVDAILSKNSESNVYYHCISKFTNQLRSKCSNNKKTCQFQINVVKLRKLLQRTSSNYDNYAITKYLHEVAALLTEKTDIKVGVGIKDKKARGSDLCFQFFIVRKNKEEIEQARLKAASDVKVKKVDCFSIKYQEEIKRQFKTNAFYCLDKNNNIQQIRYVIFNDLIANPQYESFESVTPKAVDASKNASFEPKSNDGGVGASTAPQAASNGSDEQSKQNASLSPQQVLKIKALPFKQPYFNKEKDCLIVPVGVIEDFENISYHIAFLEGGLREKAVEVGDHIRFEQAQISIDRALLTKLLARDNKGIVALNLSYRGHSIKAYRFDTSFLAKLLAESLNFEYHSLVNKKLKIADGKVICSCGLKSSKLLSLTVRDCENLGPITLSLVNAVNGRELFVGKDKLNSVTTDWYFILNTMQYAHKHNVGLNINIKSAHGIYEDSLHHFLSELS